MSAPGTAHAGGAAPETDACGCAPPERDPGEDIPPWWRDRALALPLVAGIGWITGLILGAAGHDLPAAGAFAVALAAGGATFAPDACRRLVTGRGRGRLGVGLLMTIAAIGAVALGHLGEAAALAFLFSISETLEDRALGRARHGLRALLALIPETARVTRDGADLVIPAAEVRLGDTLIVGAGERVATDGRVVGGRSWLDTSAITGESIPVDAEPGSDVAAGSVNGPGTLTIEASADGTDNSLTTIVSLVEQAQSEKGERARLADRIARPLVPLVLIAAALVAGIGSLLGEPGVWIERALVVLVAASPCALAIAVPVTVISAIGAASRLGVIIKSGAAFEELGTIRHVAFDKTGTLTRNRPQVVAVEVAPGIAGDAVVIWAAALEATSSHPLAAAVTAAAVTAAAERPAAHEVRELPGHGLSGDVGGHRIRVGSPRWVEPGPLGHHVTELSGLGMSVIVVECDGAPAGVIGVRDELRPGAADAVAALHDAGLSTVMLTGDNALTAIAVARRAGIDEIRADQLPADKARYVRDSSARRPTAMIGDGTNDAPALASATVGIVMGATGSAAAVDSADIAFTGTDLRLIPAALAHARRGRRIMAGNIVLALAIIVVLCPLALFGVLGLTAVVLVHEIAEVVVIGNGVRAARAPHAVDHQPAVPVAPGPAAVV